MITASKTTILRLTAAWALMGLIGSGGVVSAFPQVQSYSDPVETQLPVETTLDLIVDEKDGDDFENQIRMAAETLRVREHDEIWFVDARQSHYSDHKLCGVYRIANDVFVKQEFSQLIQDHQNDQSRVTVAYVHGDRTDEFYAQYRGLQVYQNLFHNSCDSRPPVRFLIWSWKSEKELLRPGRDFRIKSNRSRCVGKSFATFLDQFSDQRILLTGYSLGCQIFLEAMQEPEILQRNYGSVGGGYRLALIAPALDGHFVAAMNCGNAFSPPIEEAYIFDNSRDRALRLARFHGRRSSPGGGLPIPCLVQNGSLGIKHVVLYDLANCVGPNHAITSYTQVPLVRQLMQEMVSALHRDSLLPENLPIFPHTNE